MSTEQIVQSVAVVEGTINAKVDELVARTRGLEVLAGRLGDRFAEVLPTGFWDDPFVGKVQQEVAELRATLSDWGYLIGNAEGLLRRYNARIISVGLSLLRGDRTYADRVTLEDIRDNIPPNEYANMLQLYEDEVRAPGLQRRTDQQAAEERFRQFAADLEVYERDTRTQRASDIAEFESRAFAAPTSRRRRAGSPGR